MFDFIDDWREERDLAAAFEQGVADGESAIHSEAVQESYELGYVFGHSDFEHNGD